MNWFGGAYIDHRPENMFARFSTSDPEKLLKVFDEASIVQGSAQDWLSDRSGLLAGELLMKKYGWRLGQKISLKGDIYPVNLDLTIRATFKAPDETGVYFHHQAIEEALPRVKGFVGWYWIKAASLEAVERLPKADRRDVREQRPPRRGPRPRRRCRTASSRCSATSSCS